MTKCDENPSKNLDILQYEIIVSPRYVSIVEKCCPCGHVNTKQVGQVLY